jgi:outer membrane lipoprotein-sorting protein
MIKTTLFVYLALLVSFAQAEPLAPADVKSLLGRIRDKRAASPQMQADFQEEKTMKMMNKPISSSGKVWFQSPNKFRREMKGNAPSTTVSNGQQLWIYYPKFQSAEKYTLGKRGRWMRGSPRSPRASICRTSSRLITSPHRAKGTATSCSSRRRQLA